MCDRLACSGLKTAILSFIAIVYGPNKMTHIGFSSPRNSQLLPVCLIALCTLIPALASADDVYKWTGDDGKINYTQMPPPSGYPSELIKQAYSPPDPPMAVESATDEPQAGNKEPQKGQESDAARTKREKANAEIRRLNCDAATRNLAALQEEGQRTFMTADGERLRPTDEERKKLIDTARQQVKDYCDK